MNRRRVAAVVLAAGGSSRLGRPKQLLEFEGWTLIRRTVETVAASNVDWVVVTMSKNGVDFERELHGLEWMGAVVESPQCGQSESIKAGLRAVEERGEFEGVLFTPCDLPLLSKDHLNTLVAIFQDEKWDVVASRYEGILGAPMIVGRGMWPELHALQGDVGARKIVPGHLESTTSVVWEAGLIDLDTPEDVQRYKDRMSEVS